MKYIVSVLFLCCASALHAAPIGGIALMDPSASHLKDRRGFVSLFLALSQAVPYRVIYLEQPNRIVIEFFEVNWPENATDALTPKRHIQAINAGRTASGRSFLVLSLNQAMALRESDLRVDPQSQQAELFVRLEPISQEAFAAKIIPNTPDQSEGFENVAEVDDTASRPLIVIDPGHGGTDSGALATNATTDQVKEADLMLSLAMELRDYLLRTDAFDVILTREGDYFVSLEERVSIAHVNQADAFISLHADKVTQGVAHGTTVYTLADEAFDTATQLLTERHAPNQVLPGMDFIGQDDVVVEALLDIARKDAQQRSEEMARFVLAGILSETGQVNRKPMRSGGFSVLKSAQVPSILIEAGFLSTPEDLNNLMNAQWRAQFVEGLSRGLIGWFNQDKSKSELRLN